MEKHQVDRSKLRAVLVDWRQRAILSVEESAGVTGISRAYLYRLIATGELASLKVGRRRCIRPSAIEDYLDRISVKD